MSKHRLYLAIRSKRTSAVMVLLAIACVISTTTGVANAAKPRPPRPTATPVPTATPAPVPTSVPTPLSFSITSNVPDAFAVQMGDGFLSCGWQKTVTTSSNTETKSGFRPRHRLSFRPGCSFLFTPLPSTHCARLHRKTCVLLSKPPQPSPFVGMPCPPLCATTIR